MKAEEAVTILSEKLEVSSRHIDGMKHTVDTLAGTADKLVHTTDNTLAALRKITEVYEQQIQHLQECRDRLAKENAELLAECAKNNQFMRDLISSARNETNVNIRK